ncbi:SsgA family sporulation/cell division regulator [Streptomyces omiyaensis]|uniref:SsgA family sporulation/cell division regulator n=1 Tax=Streptomyces omiyaensis TaxID=68247 RepID=A0ABW7C5T6_9ACTN|nr:SsgA family sporulation/cell division regulator [Streptomyces omiyaensis]GGY77008.1 hypothetical protein GCM10010363_67520 [Streptomyces omiyaensis]
MSQPRVAPLPAPRVLTRPVPMELLGPDVAVRIDTTVGYTSRDPHALSIAFHLLGDDSVVWRLDRETVVTGSLAPVGEGEVHLWPDADGGLLLRLGPAGHRVVIRCDVETLTRVVRDTFVLVPPGTEERHIDWGPFFASLGL